MLAAFQANPDKPDVDDDIEYLKNPPICCKELTPEMLEQPEFKALQELAYDGTPEEVARNFKTHAFDALTTIINRTNKNEKVDQVEAERAMHFFNEAFAQEYKEYQLQYQLYWGRAKLNLLIAQFGKCKEDSLEAIKINDTDEHIWLVLARSRFFVEKW